MVPAPLPPGAGGDEYPGVGGEMHLSGVRSGPLARWAANASTTDCRLCRPRRHDPALLGPLAALHSGARRRARWRATRPQVRPPYRAAPTQPMAMCWRRCALRARAELGGLKDVLVHDDALTKRRDTKLRFSEPKGC